MAKRVMHFKGTVMQWQDTDLYAYGDPPDGVAVMEVTEKEWAKQDQLKWVRGGKLTSVAPDPEPLRLPEEQVAAHVASVAKSHMDAKARDFLYRDIDDACSYADEPEVAQFQIEGKAFRAWRSQVRMVQVNIVNRVQAGAECPTADEIVDQLPALELQQGG